MQTESERRASAAVEKAMARAGLTNAAMVKLTGVDKGTLGTFLSGVSWPRRNTRTAIESALGWEIGTIVAIADGQIDPSEVETVGGGHDHGDDSLLFMRPRGISDQQWIQIKNNAVEWIEWQLDKAAGQR